MTTKEYAIEVTNLSKSFRLPHEQTNGFKQILLNIFRRSSRRNLGYENQHVIKDISFDIQKGDFFGIVGRNGSGKSTLLKLLAGIYTPDKGTVQVNGSLTPFIELGVGFNPELTGRENVYLNGALLGFSHDEMDEMYDDIVSFAELHRFMDQKLKNYSSGMQVRLAFSIAIRSKSDILVLDEVLAVGDEAFQKKCNDYFAQIKRDKTKTIILVTHSMESVKKYCNKAMMIKNGKIVEYGNPSVVADTYSIENFEISSNIQNAKQHKKSNSIILKPLGNKKFYRSSDKFTCEIVIETIEDISVGIGLSLIDSQTNGTTSIFDDGLWDTRGRYIIRSIKKGITKLRYEIDLANYNNREFIFAASLFKIKNNDHEKIAMSDPNNPCRFAIRGEKEDSGLLKSKGKWI